MKVLKVKKANLCCITLENKEEGEKAQDPFSPSLSLKENMRNILKTRHGYREMNNCGYQFNCQWCETDDDEWGYMVGMIAGRYRLSPGIIKAAKNLYLRRKHEKETEGELIKHEKIYIALAAVIAVMDLAGIEYDMLVISQVLDKELYEVTEMKEMGIELLAIDNKAEEYIGTSIMMLEDMFGITKRDYLIKGAALKMYNDLKGTEDLKSLKYTPREIALGMFVDEFKINKSDGTLKTMVTLAVKVDWDRLVMITREIVMVYDNFLRRRAAGI